MAPYPRPGSGFAWVFRAPAPATDGLMGRLPFDLPPDEIRAAVNRFRIDDVVRSTVVRVTTPPWVRRPGHLSSE
jgi:hypothetical protein